MRFTAEKDHSLAAAFVAITHEIRFEPYLKLIKNVNERVAVTKMRISCHLLPIEAGRYKKVPEMRGFALSANRLLGMSSTI